MPVDFDSVFAGLGDTWIGGLFNSVAGLGAGLLGIGFVVLLVVAVVWSFFFVAKGAGQYGIIEGYVGTIGAGKTTLATQHSLALARARDAVLMSNIPVICGPKCYDPAKVLREGGPLPPYEPEHLLDHRILPMTDSGLDLSSLMATAFQLRDERRGLVLFVDEVGVVMPARLWKDFPVALMWLLQQSRKLACEWIWTAQDPSFVEHQLRSLTSVVHYVRSYPPPSIWRRVKGKRPWLLVASAYTPMSAPRANGEGERRERRIGRRVHRYSRKWEASFDTDGVVLPSRHIKGAGEVIDAVRNDRHAVLSNWGEGMGDGSVVPPTLVEAARAFQAARAAAKVAEGSTDA